MAVESQRDGMSHADVGGGAVEADSEERARSRDQRSGGGLASTLAGYARRGAASGLLAGLLGGAVAVRGVRALRRGDRSTGLRRVALGGVLVAAAVGQRRRRHSSSGAGAAEPADHEGGVDGARDVAAPPAETDAEPESSAGEPGPETAEQTSATGQTESYERLGEAAFDEHSGRVPAPQRAFDRSFLVLSGEAHWGIRETDGLVVMSQRYDPMAEGDRVRYVASTQIDDSRTVTVPDRIRDHWDEAFGGVAVESGDDVVFATTDALAADDQVAVVPERWSDDLLDEST